MLLLYTLALTGVALGLGPAEKSQRKLIAALQGTQLGEKPVTYLYSRPYSAEFYSRGTARLARDPKEAEGLFRNDTIDYFAIAKGDLERLPLSFRIRVTNLGLINRNYLLVENPVPSPLRKKRGGVGA